MKKHCSSRLISQIKPTQRINLSLVKTSALLTILLLLPLSGCSPTEDFILHHSGIMSEEDYQKYIELRDSGQLDQDGLFVASELDAAPQFSPPAGSIHVTFAKNAYIEVEYYHDSALQTKVDATQCYLMPGDSIYYDPESLICEHPSSRWYAFDRFCVYACDKANDIGHELSWDSGENDPQLVCQIPEDYDGAEVSIAPVGKYIPRTIELTDYYTDSTGQTQELTGTWIVNDEMTSGKSIEVNPVDPLTVDFKYDPEKYSFVSSNPGSFYHENGLVRFDTTDASENITRYSVELRSLDGTFLFDPFQYPLEHGTVEFEYLGRSITEKSYIPDGGALQYTATPDSGYRHPKGTGQIIVNVSDIDETNTKIREAVTFYSDKNVEVNLLQPRCGGSIEYIVDGRVLTGETCKLPAGTVITMNFDSWEGWICNVNDGVEYTVTEQPGQTASVSGIDLGSNAFEEADSYKPLLNVILTNSVKDAQFQITTLDIHSNDLNYGTGSNHSILPDLLGKNDRLIFSEKVGTFPDIRLTIKDDTILTGYALKLEIVTKDTRGQEHRSIRYIRKLPVEESIELYDQNERSKSSTVYESVTVTVSKVEVVTYSSMTTEHAAITASLNDVTEPCELKDGDVLEASREVKITITPENGYYVTGSKDSSGAYSETMKYSKWQKDFQKILDKHPARKTWFVTLDDSDSYGTCTYKLDGVTVSGRIGVREGQKLTLSYELTDDNYQIVRKGAGGFLGGLLHSKTESCNIPVSEALDNQTVRRSDYITVERKEG